MNETAIVFVLTAAALAIQFAFTMRQVEKIEARLDTLEGADLAVHSAIHQREGAE